MPACTPARPAINRRPGSRRESDLRRAGAGIQPSATRVMRHGRERLVEMMQPPLPFLILRRAAKPDLVRIERFPAYQQQEFVRALDAAAELMRYVPGHGSDDALSFVECEQEFLGL